MTIGTDVRQQLDTRMRCSTPPRKYIEVVILYVRLSLPLRVSALQVHTAVYGSQAHNHSGAITPAIRSDSRFTDRSREHNKRQNGRLRYFAIW